MSDLGDLAFDAPVPADSVSLADSGGNTTETDVEGAIAELYGMVGGGGLFDAYAQLREEQSSGTQGGDATSGSWVTRVLNTEVFDVGGIVSLSSNQFTLGAGSYFISARAPSFGTDQTKLKIRNVTDSSDALIGETHYFRAASPDAGTSFVSGRIVIAGTKAFELQHRFAAGRSFDGLGVPNSFSVVEVYSVVEIWREA